MRTALVCLLLAWALGSGCRCVDQSRLRDDSDAMGPTHVQFWELERDLERYGRDSHWHMIDDPWDEW